VAHSILVISYHIIQRKEPYRELGGDYFDQRRPEATANRLLNRLQHLGYDISTLNNLLFYLLLADFLFSD
jgi:transposase